MQLPRHSEGWYLLIFSVLFFIGLALAVDYVGPEHRIWPDRIMEVIKLMPYVVIVGGAITAMIVEGVYMLAERYLRRRFQEGEQKGRREMAEEWQAWNERRLEAERRGEDFNEPPPSGI